MPAIIKSGKYFDCIFIVIFLPPSRSVAAQANERVVRLRAYEKDSHSSNSDPAVRVAPCCLFADTFVVFNFFIKIKAKNVEWRVFRHPDFRICSKLIGYSYVFK